MAMGLEPVGVEAVVKGLNAFTSQMGQMQKSIDQMAQSADKTQAPMSNMGQAADGAGITMNSLMGVVQKVVVALGLYKVAVKAAQTAWDLGMTAARVQEMNAVLRVMADNAGLTTSAVNDAVESVKDMGIETQVAQKTITQFARYEMDMGKAADLARVAQDAAVISMQNSSEALDGLIHGITTYNPRVLRTYGLNVNMAQAFDDFAEAAGKSVENLTSAEKTQAALNAVLNEGTRITGAYAAAMEEPGKRLRSLPRYVNELKVALGEAFLPVVGAVADGLTNLVKAVLDNADAWTAFLKPIGEAIASVITFTTGVATLFAKFAGADESLNQTNAAIATLGQTMESQTPIADELARRWQALNDAADIKQGIAFKMQRTADAAAYVARNFPDAADEVQNLSRAYAEGEIDMIQYNHAIWTIAASNGLVADSFYDVLEAERAANAVANEAEAVRWRQIAVNQQGGQAIDEVAAAERRAAQDMAATNQILGMLNDKTYVAIDAHDQLAGRLANEARQMWAVNDAMNAYILRTADALIGVSIIEQSVARATATMQQDGEVAADTLLNLGNNLLTEAEKIRQMGPAFPKEDLDNFNASVDETILLIQQSTNLTDAQKEALINLANAARETANSNRQSNEEMATAWEESLRTMSQSSQEFYDRMLALTAEEWVVSLGFETEGLPEGILPTSPKSRWQKRLEMLDAWTSSHTIGIQFAVEGAGAGTGQGMLEEMEALYGFGGKLGGLGRYFGDLFEEQQIDPLEARAKALTERIEELNDALHSGRIDAGMYNKIMYDLALTEEERAGVLEELARKQERLAALQEAQQQFEFLQQQQQLLDLISEYGLDPEDILGGVELGADASAEAIMMALTRAMEAIVAQGAAAFGGAGIGLPGGERGTLAAPMVTMLPPAGGVNVAVGPNYINNGMDEAMFAARVQAIVADAIAP